MLAKSTMPLVFFALGACGHAERPPAMPLRPAVAATLTPPEAAPLGELAPAEAAPSSETAAPPAQTLADADRLYESQLGATRAAQFEIDRQVTELRRAVLLYKQFLERAEDQPDMAAAVRKSRERIVDACDTIVFLLHTSAPFNPKGC
jgi:hypothetical protein